MEVNKLNNQSTVFEKAIVKSCNVFVIFFFVSHLNCLKSKHSLRQKDFKCLFNMKTLKCEQLRLGRPLEEPICFYFALTNTDPPWAPFSPSLLTSWIRPCSAVLSI